MSKLFSMIIFLAFSSYLHAKECGPRAKDGKNTIATMLECAKEQTNCLELKDLKGAFYKVDLSSKMFFKITSAKFVKDSITLQMDSNSSCWFETLTKKSAGKSLAFIDKDIILTMPMIQAQISGGQVQITAPEGSGINLGLCQSIFSACMEEKPKKEAAPVKGSFLYKMQNPPDINRKEVNARYGSVMESSYWVTDQSSFAIYEDGSLNKIKKVFPVPMTAEANKKSVPFFYGMQDFNMKTKKYVFTKKAIKLHDGWVKREDIAPFNVIELETEAELKKAITSGIVAKKCPGLVGGTQEETEMLYRNFEVALCIKVGQSECEDFISKTQDESAKISCPKSLK